MRTVAAGVVLAALLSLPSGVAGQVGVRERLNAYYSDLSDRSWDTFPDHFWPGATITTVWMPPGAAEPEVLTQTAEEFAVRGPVGPGSREIFEERPVSMEVQVRDGLAMAWVRYEARFGDPGDITEWQGTDAFTLLRHDGEWRITALAYAADQEETPEQR